MGQDGMGWDETGGMGRDGKGWDVMGWDVVQPRSATEVFTKPSLNLVVRQHIH